MKNRETGSRLKYICKLVLMVWIGDWVANRLASKRLAFRNVVLFPNDLDQHPFLPPPIELAVEKLLPGAKIQFAICHSHYNFTAHHLAFQVRIGVVFARAVMKILADGFMRGEFFQPGFVIVMQPALIVVDEDRGGDVHGIDKA